MSEQIIGITFLIAFFALTFSLGYLFHSLATQSPFQGPQARIIERSKSNGIVSISDWTRNIEHAVKTAAVYNEKHEQANTGHYFKVEKRENIQL